MRRALGGVLIWAGSLLTMAGCACIGCPAIEWYRVLVARCEELENR